MYDQEELHAVLARRVLASAGPQAATTPVGHPTARATAGPSTADSSDANRSTPTEPTLAELAGLAAAAAERNGVAAVAVLRRFDPASFVGSAAGLALGLAPEVGAGWYAAFTRTVFLYGNPANLAERFHFDHVAPDGSVAWCAPRQLDRLSTLRRLLPLVNGVTQVDVPAEVSVRIPLRPDSPDPVAGGRVRTVEVATGGVSLAEYLVHVNHLVAEAVLGGLVGYGDTLQVRHVPRLGRGSHELLRVQVDGAQPVRLRAYAGLVGTPVGAAI